MDGPVRFKKPAVEVDAMQFKGHENLIGIFQWLNGIIYIPEGTDSAYRKPDEYDEELMVLSTAPGFGIIMTQSGYDRVNAGDWIVRYDADHISVYDEMDFAFKFETVDA